VRPRPKWTKSSRSCQAAHERVATSAATHAAPEQRSGPVRRTNPQVSRGALGRIRTCNLLIRSVRPAVSRRLPVPLQACILSCCLPKSHDVPRRSCTRSCTPPAEGPRRKGCLAPPARSCLRSSSPRSDLAIQGPDATVFAVGNGVRTCEPLGALAGSEVPEAVRLVRGRHRCRSGGVPGSRRHQRATRLVALITHGGSGSVRPTAGKRRARADRPGPPGVGEITEVELEDVDLIYQPCGACQDAAGTGAGFRALAPRAAAFGRGAWPRSAVVVGLVGLAGRTPARAPPRPHRICSGKRLSLL